MGILKRRVVAFGLGLGMVLGVSLMVLMPGVASAYAPSPNSTPQQQAVDGGQGAPDGPDGVGVPSSSGGLPFTGGDIAGMTIVGLVAVGAGSALVFRSRRTATQRS